MQFPALQILAELVQQHALPLLSSTSMQPVAKPAAFTNFLLQRTASVPPAGTMLGGSLAKYRLSRIPRGHSENHIPQMTAPLFPSKEIINRKKPAVKCYQEVYWQNIRP